MKPGANFDPDANVLVIDVIGELRGWWGCADVAYVGGSIGNRGGQNMIEPAAFGLPVCFGPNTRNFKDVVGMLLAEDAARVVKNRKQLADFVEMAISNQVASQKMGAVARRVVLQQQGAADRTVEHILKLINRTVSKPAPGDNTANAA